MKHLLYKLSGLLYWLPINNRYLLGKIASWRIYHAPPSWHIVTTVPIWEDRETWMADVFDATCHLEIACGVNAQDIDIDFPEHYGLAGILVFCDQARADQLHREFMPF